MVLLLMLVKAFYSRELGEAVLLESFLFNLSSLHLQVLHVSADAEITEAHSDSLSP